VNDGPWQPLGSHALFDTVTISADLRRGANRVRIRLCAPGPGGGYSGFAWGSWVFAVRAIMTDGHVLAAHLPAS
jgi:hypothetical protein